MPRRGDPPAIADAATRPPLAALKRAWNLEDVIRTSGVPLVRAGEDRLVGPCPFHEDRTPSFTVYRAAQRFHCYGRCHRHGDVLDFVQHVRGCSLADALRWLAETWPTGSTSAGIAPYVARPAEDRIDTGRTFGPQPGNGQPLDWRSRPENALSPTPAAVHAGIEPGHDADFGLALTLATALYAQTLPQHPDAVAYLRWRGISLSAARALHLGYADGRALADYLTSEPELRAAARACGLVGRGSAERFAGRLVVPEIRAGRTVWLIGRRVPPAGGARREASASREASPPDDPADRSPARGHREPPKYLGLTAPRHFLLGYGRTCAALARLADRASGGEPLVPGILVVEGALDYVVAQDWHLPAPCVALLGTHPSPGQFAELADLRRRARGAPLVLALDNDEAGRTATRDLARSLARQGLTLVILPPVADVKDLGELALLPSGRACLLRLLDEVCRHPTSAGFDHVREPPPDVIAARDRADARAGDAGAGGTP